MAASVDYHSPGFGSMPHRRPLPAGAHPQFIPQPDQFSHSRTRTTSSNVLPPNSYQNYSSMAPQPTSRRTLSNATTSTTASSTQSHHNQFPNRPAIPPPAPSSYASSIRRSTSSRSGASIGGGNSYVALLRKQKATVWCDKAQHEDPRLLAQQQAAKRRAQAEMVGGANQALSTGRTHNSGGGGITGGVRSKIRHHGAVKASAYSGGLGTQGNLSGAGVPMRLSASEVDDEQNSENGEDALERRYHQRNGSGRSSLGSQHRTQSGYFSNMGVTNAPPGMRSSTMRTRSSNASTPPGNSPVDTRQNSLPLSRHATTEEETPVPDMYAMGRGDYFNHSGGNGNGSASSSEERFGNVGALNAPSGQYAHLDQQQQKKTNDELRRRGSVDDRTTTMSGVRLFVANPDMDSD